MNSFTFPLDNNSIGTPISTPSAPPAAATEGARFLGASTARKATKQHPPKQHPPTPTAIKHASIKDSTDPEYQPF